VNVGKFRGVAGFNRYRVFLSGTEMGDQIVRARGLAFERKAVGRRTQPFPTRTPQAAAPAPGEVRGVLAEPRKYRARARRK